MVWKTNNAHTVTVHLIHGKQGIKNIDFQQWCPRCEIRHGVPHGIDDSAIHASIVVCLNIISLSANSADNNHDYTQSDQNREALVVSRAAKTRLSVNAIINCFQKFSKMVNTRSSIFETFWETAAFTRSLILAVYGVLKRGETSIPITRLLARNYGSSEYSPIIREIGSPKIGVIGSIVDAVTSIVRFSMQFALQCMYAVHCTHSRTVPYFRHHGLCGSVRRAFSTWLPEITVHPACYQTCCHHELNACASSFCRNIRSTLYCGNVLCVRISLAMNAVGVDSALTWTPTTALDSYLLGRRHLTYQKQRNLNTNFLFSACHFSHELVFDLVRNKVKSCPR